MIRSQRGMVRHEVNTVSPYATEMNGMVLYTAQNGEPTCKVDRTEANSDVMEPARAVN